MDSRVQLLGGGLCRQDAPDAQRTRQRADVRLVVAQEEGWDGGCYIQPIIRERIVGSRRDYHVGFRFFLQRIVHYFDRLIGSKQGTQSGAQRRRGDVQENADHFLSPTVTWTVSGRPPRKTSTEIALPTVSLLRAENRSSGSPTDCPFTATRISPTSSPPAAAGPPSSSHTTSRPCSCSRLSSWRDPSGISTGCVL